MPRSQPGLGAQAEGRLAGGPSLAISREAGAGEVGKLARGVCGPPFHPLSPPTSQVSALGTLFGFPVAEFINNVLPTSTVYGDAEAKATLFLIPECS